MESGMESVIEGSRMVGQEQPCAVYNVEIEDTNINKTLNFKVSMAILTDGWLCPRPTDVCADVHPLETPLISAPNPS